MKASGWIYDAYPEGDQIILWMKTDDGRVLTLTDSYLAEFYASPKEQQSVGQLAEAISGHPLVETASVCTRYIRINDQERSEVVQVAVRPAKLRRVVCDLDVS